MIFLLPAIYSASAMPPRTKKKRKEKEKEGKGKRQVEGKKPSWIVSHHREEICNKNSAANEKSTHTHTPVYPSPFPSLCCFLDAFSLYARGRGEFFFFLFLFEADNVSVTVTRAKTMPLPLSIFLGYSHPSPSPLSFSHATCRLSCPFTLSVRGIFNSR